MKKKLESKFATQNLQQSNQTKLVNTVIMKIKVNSKTKTRTSR